MPRFLNSRNNNRNKFCIVIFASLVLGLLFITPHLFKIARAETTAELQAKIQERNKNLEELNKEINLYKDLADKTSQEAKTLQNTIKSLEANAKMLDADIKKIQAKIDIASLDIKKIDINIHSSEEKIKEQKDMIASSIKYINYNEDYSLIENLLNKNKLSDALIEIDNLQSLSNSLKNKILGLKEAKTDLETNKVEKEKNKVELGTLAQELVGKKKVIDQNKSEQTKVLNETKSQEQTYQALLKDRMAKKDALEKEIFEYESSLSYKLDPSKIPQSGSSALQWPVDKVLITQYFGKTVAAKRLYQSGSHNGLDLGVPVGTPVKSPGSGIVLGSGDTDITCRGASWGRWIAIKYDNGLSSTFGHLSVINVQAGDRVTTGQIVGYSGNTGYSTGPHLHISMYPGDAMKVETRPSASCGGKVYTMPIAPVSAYLDPLLYFPQSGYSVYTSTKSKVVGSLKSIKSKVKKITTKTKKK